MWIADKLRQAGRIGPGASYPFQEHFQLSCTNGLAQDLMVAFALVGVGDGEVGHGFVELVAPPKIASDLGRLTGTGVGSGQAPAAGFCVRQHRGRSEQFHEHLEFR
jgi:hypothetical protein